MPVRSRLPVRTSFLALTIAATSLTFARLSSAQTLNANQQLARDIYKELIEINTTSDADPGGTTQAAEAMRKRLLAAGFSESDVQVLSSGPRDGNLVARLHGSGASSRKPILLLAHLDVVPAKREDWSMDPFAFTEKDGFYYGRGTSDDKAMAAIWIANSFPAGTLRMASLPSADVWLSAKRPEAGVFATATGAPESSSASGVSPLADSPLEASPFPALEARFAWATNAGSR